MKDSRKSVIKIWVQRPKPKGNNRLEKRKEMSWSPHVFTNFFFQISRFFQPIIMNFFSSKRIGQKIRENREFVFCNTL